jgi:hypothetical protein
MSVFLIWVSRWMGAEFDELHAKGEKVGEKSKHVAIKARAQNGDTGTSCVDDDAVDAKLGSEDEGQVWKDNQGTPQGKPALEKERVAGSV